MAKLSAHGIEIGRIEYTSKTIAFFNDGSTLINNGFGWKKHAKIKSEYTPQQAFDLGKEKQIKFREQNPAFRKYQDLMLDIPLSIRWKVITAFEMMDGDIDGVWSSLDDSYETRGRFSFEDLAEINEARKAAAQEKADKALANLEITTAPAEVTA